MDSFAAAVESVRPGMGLALNVSAPPAFAMRWLVPRLARFSLAHGDVAIRISSNPENIDGGQLQPVVSLDASESRLETSEVAIRFGTGLYPGCQVEKVLTPDYVLVCSPRLLHGDPPLRQPEDVAAHILIHDESIPAVEQRPSWPEWFKLANVVGPDNERGPRFSNSILVQEAAVEGQGVALALRQQVEADVAAGRLVIPFAISLPSAYAYFLVVQPLMAERPVVRAFKDWLQVEIGHQYGD